MPKQVQVPSVGMIALGVFIVAFVLLMVVGYSFIAALLFALVVGAAVAIYFLIARDRHDAKSDGGSAAGRSGSAGSAAAPLVSDTPPAPEPARSDPKPAPAAAPEAKAPPVPEPAPSAPGPAPAAAPEAAAPAGDRTEPPRLDAPRDGGADDLKRIKGIGPKIEEALNGMGIYHLDQIAAWGPAEVAWMDEHREDFRGRASRDDWAGQARHLAEGGETEFSRRVDEGNVYD